jgi:hypothetical protein
MYRQRDFIEPCPHGTYMPTTNSNSLMCLACPGGFSCIRKSAATACSATQYSLEGEIHCHECPTGASCPTKSNFVMCSEGQYSGYGVTTCTSCEAGYHCPDQFQDRQKCPPGTYQDATGQKGCKTCAVGTYTSAWASTTCTACPAGSYCPFTDKPPVLCPYGTYSSGSTAICSKCSDGYLCEEGETSATPAGKQCGNGFICNPGRQLVAAHQNIPCPPGYTLRTSGHSFTSRTTACIQCPAGAYCTAGSTTNTTCPVGHYCPAGTRFANEFPCPEGTYRSSTGATALTDCVDCTAGNFCPRGTGTPRDCPPGMYCTDNSSGTPVAARCPGGTYSGDSTVATAAGCTACPAGYYCPIGSITPVPCPPGTLNPSTNKQYIFDCVTPAAGTQATIWGNSAASGDPCTAGHYCPVGSLGSPSPCPAGTFTDATNLIQASECTACTAGFACEEGTGAGVKDKIKCAAGYYCPAGTSDPYANPCPAGTYSANTDNDASGDCTACVAGYYCPKASTDYTAYECPIGHYCTAGTQTAYQYPCPAGTYNHITKLKASTECFDCPVGYYCEEGSTEPTACPVGTYAPGTNYVAAFDDPSSILGCEPCPAGQV